MINLKWNYSTNIYIDYLIDLGLDIEAAKNVDRDELISQKVFQSLLQETSFVKQNPQTICQTDKMAVEINGTFVYNNSMYDYNFSTLKKTISYAAINGEVSGTIDLTSYPKPVWVPIVVGSAACMAAMTLCARNCESTCDGSGGVAFSACYLCGSISLCECKFLRESEGI
ncbi:MAG: hypothetical protein L3J53_02525 [Proteobacteria bacterium]|nr:hypothetical protein [Pseudomonadota bacterium]